MRRLTVGTGLIFFALLIFYFNFRSGHRESPEWLFYSMALAACIFAGLLIFTILHRRRK